VVAGPDVQYVVHCAGSNAGFGAFGGKSAHKGDFGAQKTNAKTLDNTVKGCWALLRPPPPAGAFKDASGGGCIAHVVSR